MPGSVNLTSSKAGPRRAQLGARVAHLTRGHYVPRVEIVLAILVALVWFFVVGAVARFAVPGPDPSRQGGVEDDADAAADEL